MIGVALPNHVTSSSNNLATEFVKKQQHMLNQYNDVLKLKPKRGTSVRAKMPRRPIVIENSPMRLQPRRVRSSATKSKRPIVIHNRPERQRAHGMITRSMAKRPVSIETPKVAKPVRGILRKTPALVAASVRPASVRAILRSPTSVRVVPPSSKRSSIHRTKTQTRRTIRSQKKHTTRRPQMRQTIRMKTQRHASKPLTRRTVRIKTQRSDSPKAMYIAAAPGHPKKNSGANVIFNDALKRPKLQTPPVYEPMLIYKKRSPSNFSKMVDGNPSSHIHWQSLGDHRPFCERLAALSKQVSRSQFNAVLRDFHKRIVAEIDKHVSDCNREPMCALGLKAINSAFNTAIKSESQTLIHDINLYCDALRSNHAKLFFTKKYLEPHYNTLLEAAVFEVLA